MQPAVANLLLFPGLRTPAFQTQLWSRLLSKKSHQLDHRQHEKNLQSGLFQKGRGQDREILRNCLSFPRYICPLRPWTFLLNRDLAPGHSTEMISSMWLFTLLALCLWLWAGSCTGHSPRVAASDNTRATLVDVVDFVGIVIATGHVVHVPNRPPVVGVVGGCVGMGLGLDTTEECQAPVHGHSGQIELQLVQKMTRPEEIGMSSQGNTGPLHLQLPGKREDRKFVVADGPGLGLLFSRTSQLCDQSGGVAL